MRFRRHRARQGRRVGPGDRVDPADRRRHRSVDPGDRVSMGRADRALVGRALAGRRLRRHRLVDPGSVGRRLRRASRSRHAVRHRSEVADTLTF